MSFLQDTDGLRLDPVTRADLPQLLKWRNSAALRSRTREWRPLTMEDQERWFARITAADRHDHMFVVSLAPRATSPKADAALVRATTKIGVIGLCNWNTHDRTAEISFYIGDEKYQGKGLMSRALRLLIEWGFDNGLRRVWAEAYDFNKPSINILVKLGFLIEGQLRSHVVKGGRPCDSVMLGILEVEWREWMSRRRHTS